MIEQLLQNKTDNEKHDIKVSEIAKLNFRGFYIDPKYNLRIEVTDIAKIIRNGEPILEIYARAWKNGKQVGFGPEGSIDIERFLFQNPPVMVYDDVNGNIIRQFTDHTGQIKQKKLREDPLEAIQSSLAHTIHVSCKENTIIIPGKIGHTTSTFYPDAGTGGTTVDGTIRGTANATWATIHDATDGASTQPTDAILLMVLTSLDGTYLIYRGAYLFSTGTIGAINDITAATISFAGTGTAEVNQTNTTLDLVQFTPSVANDLVTADYDLFGTTNMVTSFNISSWDQTDGTYNNLTLNADGINIIDKRTTELTKYGVRTGLDRSNTAPGTGEVNRIESYFADQAGTTSDPKLVVTHTSSSVKTINGLTRLSMVTRNGLARLSIKNFNGLTNQ